MSVEIDGHDLIDIELYAKKRNANLRRDQLALLKYLSSFERANESRERKTRISR